MLHGRLARALWMLDREQEALPHAGRSLQLNPTDDRMWFVRGKCHQILGQITEARLDLQTYLELHPDDELAVEALVEIGLDQGHRELAVERALKFVDDYPEIGSAARFGRLLHARKMHDRAIPFFRRAMEQDPLAPADRRGSRGRDRRRRRFREHRPDNGSAVPGGRSGR